MSKIRYEDKVNAIRKIERGEESAGSIARKLGINKSSVQDWLIKYESQGIESLRRTFCPASTVCSCIAIYSAIVTPP